MKMPISFLFLFCSLFGAAQPPGVDIDDDAQNRALFDTVKRSFSDTENMDFSVESFVEKTYQIPAYNLYGQLWDTEHLRSKQFIIPFSEGQLKIILVESYNTPFVFPCKGEPILNYGQQKILFHPGTDFSLSPDSPVFACFDGVVRIAKIYGEYNKVVVIRHYNGLETVYANLGKIYVKSGQIIKAGHSIGLAGIVGKNSFATLHFEVRFMNETFDPALLFDFEERTLNGNILTLEPADFNIKPIPQKKEPIYILEKNSMIADSAKVSPNISPSYRPASHVVLKGETLYKIAKKYNISVKELLELNNLTETSTIFAGQKLKVK